MKKYERQNSTSRIPTVSSTAKMVTRQSSREARLAYNPSTVREEKRRSSNHSDNSRSQLEESQAAEITTLEEVISELQVKLDREVNDVKGETGELGQARKSLYDEVLRMKIDRDSTLLQLQQERGRHEQEITEMKKHHEGMKIACEILKKEKSAEKSELTTRDEVNLSLKVDIMKLETTIDDLTLSKDELKAENEDMKEGKDRLTEMNKDLIAINQTLKSRNEDMATANKKLTNEREELSNRNDKVVDNVTALKMKSDALKDVNDKLSAKLAETLEELSKSKVDCLKSALVLEEENKQLSEMVAEAQNALKDLGRENQALQIEIAKQNGRKWKNDTEVMPFLMAIFILNWCFQTTPLLHFSYISISDMVLQSCILPISPVLPIAEIS